MNTSSVTANKREHQRHIVIERIALKVSVMFSSTSTPFGSTLTYSRIKYRPCFWHSTHSVNSVNSADTHGDVKSAI